MRAGRIIAVIVGAILAVIGLAAFAGGDALMVIHGVARDGAGFYQSPTEPVDTATAALAARLDLGSNVAEEFVPERPVGTLRLRASSADGSAIFIGIARTGDVDRWLAGTAYERMDDVRFGSFRADTQLVTGDEPVTSPAGQGFWVASATGSGIQTLTWPSERGDWTGAALDPRHGHLRPESIGHSPGARHRT